MTNQVQKSRFLLAAGLGLSFISSAAIADVFYTNEIQGDLVSGDMELDSFSEIASWDGPEYDWGFTEGNLAAIDVRQISVRFNFDLQDGFEINFTEVHIELSAKGHRLLRRKVNLIRISVPNCNNQFLSLRR